MPGWLESVFVVLHALAAMVWVGASAALVFIAVPVIRNLAGEARAAAMHELGERWRPIGWGSLVVLGATGGPLAVEANVFDGATWSFDTVFAVKLALVACLVALAYAHDFVLGPRLAREIREGRRQATRPRLVAVGWTGFTLTIAVPILGVVLTEIA